MEQLRDVKVEVTTRRREDGAHVIVADGHTLVLVGDVDIHRVQATRRPDVAMPTDLTPIQCALLEDDQWEAFMATVPSARRQLLDVIVLTAEPSVLCRLLLRDHFEQINVHGEVFVNGEHAGACSWTSPRGVVAVESSRGTTVRLDS